MPASIVPFVSYVGSGSPFPMPSPPAGWPQIYVMDDTGGSYEIVPGTIAPIAAWQPQYVLVKVPGGRSSDWAGWSRDLLLYRRSVVICTTAANVSVWASAFAGMRDYNGQPTIVDTSLISSSDASLTAPTTAATDIANSTCFIPGVP